MSVDRGRFITDCLIKFKETKVMPEFNWKQEFTFHYPEKGTMKQWVDFADGVYELRYGLNKKYLQALKSLIDTHNIKEEPKTEVEIVYDDDGIVQGLREKSKLNKEVKKMVVLDLSGDYLNFDSTKDGDRCKILDECKPEFNEVLKKDINNMKVMKDGKTFTFSPNLSACKALQTAFGNDTKDWIGHEFEILHVQGKMAIRPLK